MAIIIIPILFYIPKFFELRRKEVTQNITVRRLFSPRKFLVSLINIGTSVCQGDCVLSQLYVTGPKFRSFRSPPIL